MEFFKNVKVVKLVSRHDKYLIADDDKEKVKQGRDGTSKNAEWAVKLVKGDANAIRLKSCYGRYLTAADEPFLLGLTGQKVVQTGRLTDRTKWIPVKDGSGVNLQTAEGKFLRANWGTPPWRNSVTHNVPLREMTQDWVLWRVKAVSKNQYESGEYSMNKGKDEQEQDKKTTLHNLIGKQSEAQETTLHNLIGKQSEAQETTLHNLIGKQSEAQEDEGNVQGRTQD